MCNRQFKKISLITTVGLHSVSIGTLFTFVMVELCQCVVTDFDCWSTTGRVSTS